MIKALLVAPVVNEFKKDMRYCHLLRIMLKKEKDYAHV